MSRADAALVARDRALPGLAALLDPARFAAALDASLRAAGGGVRVGGAELVYLRYKPETSCLAAFSVDIGGRAVHVHAKAHAAHDTDKFAKARDRLGHHDGDLGLPGVAWDDVLVVVRGFPNDRVLERLPKVATTPERRRRFLERIAPDRPDLWGAQLHPIKYKAERRFVARLDVDGRPEALLKLYGDDDFGRALAGVRSVAGVEGAGVTCVIGASRSAGALVTSWHDGTGLNALTGDGDRVSAAARAAGAALRHLHRRPDAALRGSDAARHARAVVAAADAVAYLAPALAERVRTLASEVATAMAATVEASVPLHGDFSSDQVVVGPTGEVAVIDFDDAAIGAPGVDLGSFLAQLVHDRTLGRAAGDQVEALGGGLLQGYGEAPHDLGAFVAAGLVRLAPHVFRERDDAWPERTEAVVAAAERTLRTMAWSAASEAAVPT